MARPSNWPNSTNGANIATEEYVLSGEKLGDAGRNSSAVQRITLAQPSSPDEFGATYFQRNFAGERRPVGSLQQGRTACVFSTYFAKSDQNERQMMVLPRILEVKTPQVLNLIQYGDQAEPARAVRRRTAVKAWKAQFSQQALSMVR